MRKGKSPNNESKKKKDKKKPTELLVELAAIQTNFRGEDKEDCSSYSRKKTSNSCHLSAYCVRCWTCVAVLLENKPTRCVRCLQRKRVKRTKDEGKSGKTVKFVCLPSLAFLSRLLILFFFSYKANIKYNNGSVEINSDSRLLFFLFPRFLISSSSHHSSIFLLSTFPSLVISSLFFSYKTTIKNYKRC